MSARSKVFFIITVVLVVFLCLRDTLIKAALVVAARQAAGVEVSIKTFSLSLIARSARITGIKVYNPRGFDREVMIDIPEIAIDLDVRPLLKGDLHFRYLRLDLKEVIVVRDLGGKTNVQALQSQAVTPGNEGKVNTPSVPAQAVSGERHPADIRIAMDRVSLSLGRVIYKEIRAEGEPRVRTIELGLQNREFKDIKSVNDLMARVLTETTVVLPLKHGLMKVKGLSADVVGGLMESVPGLLK